MQSVAHAYKYTGKRTNTRANMCSTCTKVGTNPHLHTFQTPTETLRDSHSDSAASTPPFRLWQSGSCAHTHARAHARTHTCTCAHVCTRTQRTRTHVHTHTRALYAREKALTRNCTHLRDHMQKYPYRYTHECILVHDHITDPKSAYTSRL